MAPRWWHLALALGLVLIVVDVVAEVATGGWSMLDLEVYRWGGEQVLHGRAVYEGAYDGVLRFTYPPAAALAFAPLALLPAWGLDATLWVASAAALVVVVWVSLGSLGWPRDGTKVALAVVLVGVSLTLSPVRQTFLFGQVNLILMAMVVVDLCLPGTSRWKGVGTGLAIGVKLTPAIFVPYLLCSGRVPAAARAVAAAAATVVVGFLVLPSDSRRYWFDGLFADDSRVGEVTSVSNQSLRAALGRIEGLDASRGLWLALAVAVGVAGLALAVVLARRGAELAGITTCAAVGLVVSPVSWAHHWVWVVPALVLGVVAALRGRWWAWVAVALGVVVAGSTPWYRGHPWQAPFAADDELRWAGWQLVVGNLYLVVVLAALVATAVAAGRAAWLTPGPGPGPGRAHRG